MLGRVGQGFGNDVVGGHFDGIGQPLVDGDAERDGDAGAAGERLESGPQSAPRQDRGMDPPGYLLEIRGDTGQSVDNLSKLLADRREFGWYGSLC